MATENKVGYGTGTVFLTNLRAGVQVTLPVNPSKIKWQGQLVMDTHDTRAGYHYQFKKYRRTSGRLGIETGLGKGYSFGLVS